jgi:hypothetical protein
MIAAMPEHGKIICWRICFFCFGVETPEGTGGTGPDFITGDRIYA